MDFLANLGRPFVASALRRVADQFQAGAGRWYAEHGIDAPVRTAGAMLLLRANGATGITDMAAELRQSHPTIIEWVRELETLGFVSSAAGEQDRRRTLISLTPAGRAQSELIFTAGAVFERAYAGLCTEIGSDVFEGVLALEQACQRKSMLDRLREAASPTRSHG